MWSSRVRSRYQFKSMNNNHNGNIIRIGFALKLQRFAGTGSHSHSIWLSDYHRFVCVCVFIAAYIQLQRHAKSLDPCHHRGPNICPCYTIIENANRWIQESQGYKCVRREALNLGCLHSEHLKGRSSCLFSQWMYTPIWMLPFSNMTVSLARKRITRETFVFKPYVNAMQNERRKCQYL